MDFKCGDLVCSNERLTIEDMELKAVSPMIFIEVVDGKARCFTFDEYGAVSGILSIDTSSLHLLTKEEAEEAYKLQYSVMNTPPIEQDKTPEIDVEDLMKMLEV